MPADVDVQAALRMQLRKAMKPTALAALLQDLLGKHGAAPGTSQTATVAGNQNTVTQIAGSNNTVR